MRDLIIVFILSAAYSVFAQTPQEIFRDTILPTLQRECIGCHGAVQTLSKLDLRTHETVVCSQNSVPSGKWHLRNGGSHRIRVALALRYARGFCQLPRVVPDRCQRRRGDARC